MRRNDSLDEELIKSVCLISFSYTSQVPAKAPEYRDPPHKAINYPLTSAVEQLFTAPPRIFPCSNCNSFLHK